METKKSKKTTDSNWQKAGKWGIDLTILDANLRKTPTERVMTHQAALEAFLAFREAGNKFYARHSKTPKVTH